MVAAGPGQSKEYLSGTQYLTRVCVSAAAGPGQSKEYLSGTQYLTRVCVSAAATIFDWHTIFDSCVCERRCGARLRDL
jgi:hypothetical protein